MNNYTIPKPILERSNIPLLLLSGFFAGAICFFFYDRFWWPPDDGAYAYVADQLNHGKHLHQEIHDVHMGYINFFNAYMLRIFGDDFLSLRYPLVLLTVLQAILISLLLKRDGAFVSVIAAFTVSSLSFVQFINPTANWYALFLMVLLIAVLELLDKRHRSRLIIAGFVLANLFLFRQLSAIFAAMACVSFVFCEEDQPKLKKMPFNDRAIAVLLLWLMLFGLSGYLFLKVNLSGVLLFGIWPVLLLVYQLQRTQVSNHVALILISRMALGFFIGLTPLVLYHILNNSFVDWIEDTVFVATSITSLEFISQASYFDIVILAFKNLFESNIRVVFNGLFWLCLLLLPLLYGVILVSKARSSARVLRPMIYLPAFYMLVSVHYEIPIYLFYSISLVLIALMLLIKERKYWGPVFSLSLLFLSGVGLAFQAGQPLSRGLDGMIRGDVFTEITECSLAHCGVSGDSATVVQREKLVSLILDNTLPTDYIMAIPFNPELYYLSKRQPPVNYYNAAFGIKNFGELELTLAKLESSRPKMIIVNPQDKYHTDLVAEFVEKITLENYVPGQIVGPFEIYLLAANTQ